MKRLTLHVWPLLRGALLGFVLGGAPAVVIGGLVLSTLAPCAVAQVSVSPATIEVSLPARQQGEVALAVTNEGGADVELFSVPLPEEGSPDDVGELLFATEASGISNTYDITMAEGERLFVARYGGGDGYTWELTPELDVVGLFESPRVETASFTSGMAWMPPEHAPPDHPDGTLWWLDIIGLNTPECPLGLEAAVLLEGDLDGDPTGRTVELPLSPGAGDFCTGVYGGLAFDAATGWFYYLDAVNEDVYAVDIDGEVAAGYPVPQTDYDAGDPLSLGGTTLDVSRGPDGGSYVESVVGLPGEGGFSRVVTTDLRGRSTGAETPLTSLEPPDGQGEVVQVRGVVRSRIDPSVMYLAIVTQHANGSPDWVVAIRAHPLPPRWLRVTPVAPASLALAPGETDTVAVRLDAEGLAPGVYEGQVALREGGPNGEEAVAVPVTLTVTEGTDAEEAPAPGGDAELSVYPNPAVGEATVALTLPELGELRVSLFDVLGREVDALHEGSLSAGRHAFDLDGRDLPVGVYFVRVVGDGFTAAQRVTIVR